MNNIKKNKQIGIYLPQDLKEQIESAAESKQLSNSAYIRLIISDYIEKIEDKED